VIGLLARNWRVGNSRRGPFIAAGQLWGASGAAVGRRRRVVGGWSVSHSEIEAKRMTKVEKRELSDRRAHDESEEVIERRTFSNGRR